MYPTRRLLSALDFSYRDSGADPAVFTYRKHVSSRRDNGIEAHVGSGSRWLRGVIVSVACISLCFFFMGLAGCGGVVNTASTSSSGNTPALIATPSAIDFGTVNVGNSANQKVTISNAGSESIQISALTLSNPAFTVDGEARLPVTLASGSSLNLNVHYTPKEDINSTGELDVLTGTSSSPAATVKLNGNGASQSAAQNPALNGLSCSDLKLTGAGIDACTVTTNIAAPTNGLAVNLSSNNSAVKVPVNVTVPQGATSATFPANASAVKNNQSVTITANQGSIAKSVSISLMSSTASSAASSLSSFSCGNSAFTGAGTTSCTVLLSSAAPSGGVSVIVTSSSSAVRVPSTVLISAGATKGSLTAEVSPVSSAQTATLTVSTGGTSKSTALELKADVQALSLSSTSISFGNVAVGTSVSKSLTVTATGTMPVVIHSDSTSGSGFSVSGAKFPVSLDPGQAMIVSVQFAPATPKQVTGQLTFSGNAPAAAVSLSGTGTSTLPTVSGLSCDSLSFTGSASDSCRVTLSGPAPAGGINVALASSSSAVTLPASLTVPATAMSAAFTASIASVNSTQSTTLKASAAGSSKSVSLRLNASAPTLVANATSISFGDVILSKLAVQTLTLTSTGAAAVTVNSVSLTGSAFSVAPIALPATLQPGQQLGLSLTFDPTITGNATGQLVINSNSSSNPAITVSLNGTGSPHHVDLTWGVPMNSPVPVVGYNVYRAPGSSGKFALLSSVAQTMYSDTTVQSGEKYQYEVTSVDSAGTESAASNITTVTIP